VLVLIDEDSLKTIGERYSRVGRGRVVVRGDDCVAASGRRKKIIMDDLFLEQSDLEQDDVLAA